MKEPDEKTLAELKNAVSYAKKNSPYYQVKLKDVNPEEINCLADFQNILSTDKHDLRLAYPLGIQAVPDEEVVRIHSSSGTTGKPIIIPYTKQDVEDWATMFARCYATAGITNLDRIQITPGYGLWTAGIGFQAGCEKLGAMAVPVGPGNTEKQLQMMVDLKTTVLCATSSYALLLAEEIAKRGIKDQIHLRKGIIGSERWGDLMRDRIANELNIELYDIYGLTEIYGPGIAINCDKNEGMHYWNDFLFFEVVDPETGKAIPEGETGELVITTLRKQAAPLIRYRTHDLTRFIPHKCSCGSEYPMIGRILGRTDDMIKVKGVNIYPGQIENTLTNVKGVSSEYQVIIEHFEGKDRMTLRVEAPDESSFDDIALRVEDTFKKLIGIKIICECVAMGSLPRSEKKSKRVFDKRFE